MATTRMCPSCKSTLDVEAHFCGVCGMALPASAQPPSSSRALDELMSRVSGIPKAVPHTSPAHGVPVVAAYSGPGSGPSRSQPVAVSLDSLIGRTLNNRYLVKRKIGEGGFGAVFEGMQVATERPVALKVLHPQSVSDATVVARFRREAEACSKLRNPHTVIIYDFDQTEDGVLYLAMEFVPGEDLEAMLRSRALAPIEALEVLAQVCDGLAYAHQKGVLHRDIKPSNIRVRREGERLLAKVMDFGVARVTGSDLTGTGILLGTFGYMAPEYIRTGLPDPRSDLFAVGVILYEALAGRRPFEGDTTATVLYRALTSARAAYQSGALDIDLLCRTMREIVDAEPLARLDYAEVVDSLSWEKPAAARPDSLLVIAASVGRTRLIDNLLLSSAQM